MTIRRVFGLLLLLAAMTAARARAGTVDGYEWPPDPKRYEPAGHRGRPGSEDRRHADVGQRRQGEGPPAARDAVALSRRTSTRTRSSRGRRASSTTITRSRTRRGRTTASTRIDPADRAPSSRRRAGSRPRTSTASPSRPSRPTIRMGGMKALWNQFHIYWNIGSYNFNALIVWAGQTRRRAPVAPGRLLPVLREPGAEVSHPESAGLLVAVARGVEDARRPPGHRRAQLSLPRSRPARRGLDLRSRPAARARGQPVEPVGRLPRIGPEPGRRQLLRRQAGGLHLEDHRRARRPAVRRSVLDQGRGRQAGLGEQQHRWLATGLAARPTRRRLPEGRMEGRGVGTGQRRAREAEVLGASRASRTIATTSTASSSCGSTRSRGSARSTASSPGRARC